MGQIRHGSATTSHAVRAAIQRSQASLAQLSRELGINPKTVAKRRNRIPDLRGARSIILSAGQVMPTLGKVCDRTLHATLKTIFNVRRASIRW
mgnify:CR=1 FL=1